MRMYYTLLHVHASMYCRRDPRHILSIPKSIQQSRYSKFHSRTTYLSTPPDRNLAWNDFLETNVTPGTPKI